MMKKWHVVFKLLVTLLSVLLVFPASFVGAVATSSASTKIVHKVSKDKYIPGFRINIEAKISDKTDLLVTRCYFKAKNDKNFAFVEMFPAGGENYQTTLPAPFLNSEAINYLFVAVNKNKQVTRTEVFTLQEGETKEATTWKDINEVKEVKLDKVQDIAERYIALYNKSKSSYLSKLPKYQTTVKDIAVRVNTELSRELVPVTGFNDTAVVTEVASSEKYGFLAEDLYTAPDIAAGGGTDAIDATSSGIISVTSGGFSTATYAIIGAVAIGAGVASSGGGGGGGTSASATSLDQTTILDYWNFSGTRPDSVSRSGNMFFTSNGTFNYQVVDGDGQSDGSGSGTWTLSGTTLTLNYMSGSLAVNSWVGTVNGDANSFTFNGHGYYTFTR